MFFYKKIMLEQSEIQVPIIKSYPNQSKKDLLDWVAVEEPLEIRLIFGEIDQRQEQSLAITMRTPGDDFELVTGFLLTEGIIQNHKAVQHIRYCTQVKDKTALGNVVQVELTPDIVIDFQKFSRHFYTSSSCGVCGKASIDAIQVQCNQPFPLDQPNFSASLIPQLPQKLREQQDTFHYTGGNHACALFDQQGNLLLLKEDVGRHNAMDKLIGAAMRRDLRPLAAYLVLVSGRASFELVQKAAVAGIPILAAVGAPSSLAIQLATELGMTLIGFVRNERCNVYTNSHRIIWD